MKFFHQSSKEVFGKLIPLNLGGKRVEIENQSEFASLVIEIDLKKSLIFYRFLLLKHFKIFKMVKNAPIGFKLGRSTNFWVRNPNLQSDLSYDISGKSYSIPGNLRVFQEESLKFPGSILQEYERCYHFISIKYKSQIKLWTTFIWETLLSDVSLQMYSCTGNTWVFCPKFWYFR